MAVEVDKYLTDSSSVILSLDTELRYIDQLLKQYISIQHLVTE